MLHAYDYTFYEKCTYTYKFYLKLESMLLLIYTHNDCDGGFIVGCAVLRIFRAFQFVIQAHTQKLLNSLFAAALICSQYLFCLSTLHIVFISIEIKCTHSYGRSGGGGITRSKLHYIFIINCHIALYYS